MGPLFPFDISYDLALTGPGAVAAADYEIARAEAGLALGWLRDARDDGSLALLRAIGARDDLAAARPIADRLRDGASEIIVFGIGGASSGAEALLGLRSSARPRISMIDNLDPSSLAAALTQADLPTTRFVAISKGGSTIESVAQSLMAADAIEAADLGHDLKDHFVVITEPGPRPMRAFAHSIGCPVIDHPPDIGGRYSMLTIAGLFPLLLSGQDASAVREGAADVLARTLSDRDGEEIPVAVGSALTLALRRAGRLRETVLWSYADKLAPFNAWWRQLWAESLGKGGRGSTPIGALGPVDQHSQLRLFFDGPAAALFTMISTDTAGEGPRISARRAGTIGFPDLADKTAGDLVAAQTRATAETLSQMGRPVRRIHAPRIDERTVGALFMHFMLETILVARMMGVDPFDQPVVTGHKPLARKYLAAGLR